MAGQYQNVNGVKALNLHGKNYVEVAERVHMVHEKRAVFSIVKSEPVNVADRWLWVAVIMVDGQQYIGNAEIKLNAPKNTPDGTNPFECGETSAIGRALAFAGFGSVESIASKDEIERGKPYEGTTEEKAAARPAQDTTKPAQEAAAPAQESNAARLQALGKIKDHCKEAFGAEKGARVYRNIRAHAVKTLNLGDVPDELMPDAALTHMWKQVRHAEQHLTVKAS